MAKANKEMENLGIFLPQDRLRTLATHSNAFDVDPKIPAKRYYRSGAEMLRMANVYWEEGSLENAYILYMKYMTLFLEKIRSHPEYATVSSDWKIQTQAKIREVLPKAEKIKQKLLEQYTLQYNRYSQELKDNKKAVRVQDPVNSGSNVQQKNIEIVLPAETDNIKYPDDMISSDNPPLVDRLQKPSPYTSISSLELGLRNVIIPSKVMSNFLNLSVKNTFNNIETCGILAGKLERNQLIITHMILPKQKGTSDSCITMNEEEIFDYQDQHDLVTIGWIHTHPTQTAFLSSVDLHTHCPYQLLMPEAIAIVCAPRYNETGFFTLDKYGLELICKCKLTGFHPHPTTPSIYMEAEHIRVDSDAPLEVADLRSIK